MKIPEYSVCDTLEKIEEMADAMEKKGKDYYRKFDECMKIVTALRYSVQVRKAEMAEEKKLNAAD